LRDIARSVWIWSAITAIALIWVPIVGVLRLFDRDPARYRTGYWLRRAGSLASKLNPAWNIEMLGELPDDPRRPYVLVYNHQSFADIPVICRLPMEMKWVIKAGLFRVPLLGWMLRWAGDIRVDRQDKNSRSQVLTTARRYLQNKCSVMFFPEGTRSRTGRVLRFTNGAFRLAVQEQVPVLPLVIDGSRDALPTDDWRYRDFSRIRLKVLPPVETKRYASGDAPDLREEVRRRIMEQLAAWRGETVEQVDANTQKHPAGKDLGNPQGASRDA
jgi:1-acyl-sn-glycerol-3-phosphate acyltransferase